MNSRFIPAAALWSALALLASAAAQEVGILVHGVGEVKAKPNLVEIDLQTAGSAEITGDAVVKYQDSKRRTLEAFNKLKMENLKIEEGGLTINGAMTPQQIQILQQGNQVQNMKVPVQIGGVLRLRLAGVQEMNALKLMETIGSLLDVAKDCGAGLGPTQQQINYGYNYQEQPLCKFVLQDFQALRDQAYKSAVADARSRAQKLAELTGIGVGSVISVQEVEVPGEQTEVNLFQMQNGGISSIPDSGSATNPRIVSNQFAEVSIRVKLQVRYAIQPNMPKAAQK